MQAFKVTRHNLTSIHCGKMATIYQPRIWTTPSMGKLFAFDSLPNTNFILNIKQWCEFYRLWRCEVENPQIIKFCAQLPSEYERFWESFPEHNPEILTFPAPRGTLVCDRLKLVEEIHVN